MKKLMKKLNNALVRMQCEATRVCSEERGDTNFISIAIILIVVIGIAVLFIQFGDRIATTFKTEVNDLLGKLGVGGI